MRKPCTNDLKVAVEALHNTAGPSADVCRRVAFYLESVIEAGDARARAKSLGCTVRYLRKVVDRG